MSFTSLAFFPFFGAYFLLSLVLPRRAWLVLAAVASSFFVWLLGLALSFAAHLRDHNFLVCR